METPNTKFSMVVAATHDTRGIGANGSIPWRLPADMHYFAKLTTEAKMGKCNCVIMGRKTYESIPKKFRPLPDRINIVITKNKDWNRSYTENVLVVHSFEEALERARNVGSIDKIFVIGGSGVYEEGLKHTMLETIYYTRVMKSFPECDVFFPSFEGKQQFKLEKESEMHEDKGVNFKWEEWKVVYQDQNHN